ncbi:MAG TPA: alpha/beta hydrolase, partial [Sporichthya sp.]|nr:alpha/beta hydrolase [Sporichthya sp.]
LGFGLAGAAVVATGVGGLAVTGNLDRAEHAARRRLNGDAPNDPPPDVPTGGLETGRFRSAAMKNTDVAYAVSYPPGSPTDAALPVVLELYGRGGNHLIPFATDNLALAKYQSAVIAAGSAPFAIATIDAGPDSYWHKRASGIDPQRLILGEYLPVLAARGLRVDRLALHGESMGGYGALLLAQRVGRKRIVAVAVDAPAIFRQAGASAPGAFDGAADFAAHDVTTGNAKLAGIPIRVVCGTQDPFYDAVKAFVALPHSPPTQTVYGKAGHTPGYWRSQTAAQLSFLARHLT